MVEDGGEGDITDAGDEPRCHQRIGVPARCSHELRGPVTKGKEEVM